MAAGAVHHGAAPKDKRDAVGFRGYVTAGTDGGREEGGLVFPAESGRYHLVVSAACPFSNRTTIMRALKGLEDVVSIGYTLPAKTKDGGFKFVKPGERDEKYPEATPDSSGLGAEYMHELYAASPGGEVTTTASVPVLWDKRSKQIVSNGSGDIMKMFNSEFEALQRFPAPDYYPGELRQEIDTLNDWIQRRINIAPYIAGNAASQQAYEEECQAVFDALDELEARLQSRRYLIENLVDGSAVPTLSDVRLYASLIRFDAVYYGRMKLNLRYIRDFPNLQAYLEDLHSDERVAGTVFLRSIKDGYYLGSVGSMPLEVVVPLGSTPFQAQSPAPRRRLGLPRKPSSEQSPPGSKTEALPAQPVSESQIKGAFMRPESAHRKWISADGSSGFRAEAGRYHLYIALNCPWCHRTALTRALLGLQDAVSMDVLYYRRDPGRGWMFNPEEPGCTEDTAAGGLKGIRDLYEREGSKEKSVPVLYDKQTQQIVNNESADIIRMFATEFGAFQSASAPQLYPKQLAQQIDDINAWIYNDIANGAYKAGFAKSQEAYEAAYRRFFDALDRTESILEHNRYLCGDHITEADIRLFPTVFRLDSVYHVRFKLNRAFVYQDYPNLQRWLQEVYALPGVQTAGNMRHCKGGYFGRSGNNLIPLGPKLSFIFEP